MQRIGRDGHPQTSEGGDKVYLHKPAGTPRHSISQYFGDNQGELESRIAALQNGNCHARTHCLQRTGKVQGADQEYRFQKGNLNSIF